MSDWIGELSEEDKATLDALIEYSNNHPNNAWTIHLEREDFQYVSDKIDAAFYAGWAAAIKWKEKTAS